MIDYTDPAFAAVESDARTRGTAVAVGGHDARGDRGTDEWPVRSGLLRADHRQATAGWHHRRRPRAAGHRSVHAGGHRRRQEQGHLPPHDPDLRPERLHRLHGVRPGLPGQRDPQHRPRDSATCSGRPSTPPTSAKPTVRLWYGSVPSWAAEIRSLLLSDSAASDLAAVARTASATLGEPVPGGQLDAVVTALAAFPVARTRPLFDAEEKRSPGTGTLFSAVVDPWKCTGCLQCIEVCGPDALKPADQDEHAAGHAGGPVRTADEAARLPRAADRRRDPAGWRHQARSCSAARITTR